MSRKGKLERLNERLAMMDSHLNLLDSALKSNIWWDLIPFGSDEEVRNACSPHDISRVIEQAQLLRAALLAVKEIHKSKTTGDIGASITWGEACEQATCQRNSKYGGRTVEEWYCQYRLNNCRFPLSTQGKVKTNCNSPLSIADDVLNESTMFDDLSIKLKEWVRENLSKLTLQKAAKYINSAIVPIMLERNSISYFPKLTIPISLHTSAKWLRDLGIVYRPHKKCYFVERHESKEAIEQRKEYISLHFENEVRECCWLQFSEEELNSAVVENLSSNTDIAKIEDLKKDAVANNRTYTPNDGPYCGQVIYEFHVDDHSVFNDASQDLFHGGLRSFRAPADEKIRVVFGHDESVYQDHHYPKGAWQIDGEHQLRKKGSGKTQMVSMFVSREFGVGLGYMTKEEEANAIKKCNEKRHGQEYVDKTAAKTVLGTDKKPKLLVSPMVRYFEFGGTTGYWTGDHLICQFEDVVDFIKVSLPCHKYEFVFEFDRSTGHAKQRPNGLHISNFNWRIGGKKPIVRESKIREEVGFLGPHRHAHCLSVGDTCLHYFLETDEPPRFQSEKTKYDVTTSTQREKNCTIKELQNALLMHSPGMNVKGKLPELQKKALAAGIPITKNVSQVTEGYVGKPIGKVELLWRRGFISPDTVKPPTDSECTKMMSELTDFKEEICQLQYVSELIGVKSILTPICHCEIAGRGVEYAWGVSKMWFRNNHDSTKHRFKEDVEKAVSNDVLPISCVRRCCRKAREYKMSYKTLMDTTAEENKSVSYQKIEKIRKSMKNKRAMGEVETKFIVDLVKEEITKKEEDNGALV